MKKNHNKTYKGTLTKYRTKEKNIMLCIFIASVITSGIVNAIIDKVGETRRARVAVQSAILAGELQREMPAEEVEVVEVPIKVAKTDKAKEVEFQIRTIAEQLNFKWADYLVRLAFYESGLNPSAVSKPNKNGSVDYGLFQWNDKLPPMPITKECAMDLKCSTEKTIEAINNGHQHHWSANEVAKRK